MMIVTYKEKDVEVYPIVGAIGWPSGGKPGYAVIVGRSIFPRIASKDHDYYLLREGEEIRAMDLIEKCVKLSRRFPGVEFVGKYSPDSAKLVGAWNDTRQSPEFYVYQAPNSSEDSISYPVEILMRLAKRGCLHNFDGTRALEDLNGLQTDEISEATCSKYPAIAAIGYAVLALKDTELNDF